MDLLLHFIITIEIVTIIVGSIIGIMINLQFIKRKLGRKNILLMEIFGSMLALIAIILGIVAFIYLRIPLFNTDVLPIWVAIAVLIMVIVRLSYDYQKINKEDTNKKQ